MPPLKQTRTDDYIGNLGLSTGIMEKLPLTAIWGFWGAWRQYGVSGGMTAIWGFGGHDGNMGFRGHDGNMGFRGQHRPDSPVALSIRWSYIASVAGGAVEERTHTACSVTVLVLGGMQALPFPDRRQPLFPICVGYFPYHHNTISALKPRYIHLHCFPIWVRFALHGIAASPRGVRTRPVP